MITTLFKHKVLKSIRRQTDRSGLTVTFLLQTLQLCGWGDGSVSKVLTCRHGDLSFTPEHPH